MQKQRLEITDYNISPKKNYLVINNSGANEAFYKVNLEFFGSPCFAEILYTGGIKELPGDLTLLLSMITKFFYIIGILVLENILLSN